MLFLLLAYEYAIAAQSSTLVVSGTGFGSTVTSVAGWLERAAPIEAERGRTEMRRLAKKTPSSESLVLHAAQLSSSEYMALHASPASG